MKESMHDFLQHVDIFSSLESEQLGEVIECLNTRSVSEGGALFHEGDPGEELYIVRSGRIATSVKLPDGRDLDIAQFQDGDFFGEMSIFEDAPRSATCYAKEESTLVSLSENDFHKIMERLPHAAIKIMYRMLGITTARLENTSEFLSDMVQWGEQARKRAVTDELTGLFNRRFLDESLPDQFARAKTRRQPLALVMVDLDHFNDINATFGHEIGDAVLKAVAPVFKSHFRESDILSRYGGDEFTFVLPDTSAEQAAEICTRVCQEVASLPVMKELTGEERQLTTSHGIAAFPAHATTLKTLQERADAALYRAKEGGRNRAVIADSE